MVKDNMILTDKFTFHTVTASFFNCYLLGYGDVENDTGYTKKQFEQLDAKYNGRKEFVFDEVDLPMIVKGMEWLVVTQNDSELLDIGDEQGLKLLNLLKQGATEITAKDWF